MSAPGNRRRAGAPKDEWGTPWPLFRDLDNEFRFTLDVCASEENRKVARFIPPELDGLRQPWHLLGDVCWMNPPYSEIAPWMGKAADEALCGATVVALIPNATETLWFGTNVWGRAAELRFLTRRVQFYEPNQPVLEGVEPAGGSGSNTGGSMVAVYRPRWRGVTAVSLWNWRDGGEA